MSGVFPVAASVPCEALLIGALHCITSDASVVRGHIVGVSKRV